eukprot:c12066_g1_i1.p1 GENE.c12066_g1_i1~~c12066_g1_i1.p1  ORF type:complete len:494 (-),score=83.47 c12066_g1_i1:323-1804(-)
MSDENAKPTQTIATPTTTQTPENVEQAISKKVLFWLSRDNLQTDTYLVSHMNADMWVDIEVLTHFKGLKALHADAPLVARVMRGSDRVVVSEDGKMIKPNFKLERKTLILRDIPSDTDQKEVEEIFLHLTGDNKPTEIKSEVGNNWFVTFATEEKCVSAHLSLMGKKFRDQPIRARVKTESLLKGIGYQPAPIATPVAYPVYSQDGQVGYQYYAAPNGTTMNPPRNQRGSGNGRGGGRQRDGQGRGEGTGKGGSKKHTGTTNSNSATIPNSPASIASSNSSSKKRKAMPAAHTVPQLGPTNFPPLPAKKDLQDRGHVSGYQGPFKQISAESMYQALSAMTEIKHPEFVTNCALVRDDADKPLHAPKPLSCEECAEVFVQVDQTPDARGMSPFISPFFSTVPSSDWPSEVALTPPAALKGSQSRAVAIEAPPSPSPQQGRSSGELGTPSKDPTSSSFRDVLLAAKLQAKSPAPSQPEQPSTEQPQANKETSPDS